MTIVNAPSGFGKTTLCAEWCRRLAAAGEQVAWIMYDQHDAESPWAIQHFLRAINHVLPGVGDASAALLREGMGVPAHYIATPLINDLLSRDDSLYVFIDDLDNLKDAQIVNFFSFLARNCPKNLHLIISCRAKPPLPVAYLKAHEAVTLITQEDLRFSDTEADELLRVSNTALKSSDRRQIQEAMLGWASGLTIAALAMKNRNDAADEIGILDYSMPWLHEYLEEHIFTFLPPPTQDFLMRCAVVDLLTADLAAELTDDRNAVAVLRWLTDQNLFVTAQDSLHLAFRLHPIARDFLRHRLAASNAALHIDLHQRASRWFAANGLWHEAVRHAFETGDTEWAANLIDRVGMELVGTSDLPTLATWIGRLPQDTILGRPRLALAQVWNLIHRSKPQAGELLARLELRVLDTMPAGDDRSHILSEILGARVNFLAIYRDDTQEAACLANRYLATTCADGSFTYRGVQNTLSWCLSVAGDYDGARRVLQEMETFETGAEPPFTMAYRHVCLAISYSMQGQLSLAERVLRTGLAKCQAVVGRFSVSVTIIACALAELLYERDQLDEAAELLEQRFTIIDESCTHVLALAAYTTKIRLLTLSGSHDEATSFVERAELLGQERACARFHAAMMLVRTQLRLASCHDPFTDLHEIVERELTLPASTCGQVARLVLAARIHAFFTAGKLAEALQTIGSFEASAKRTGHQADILTAMLWRIKYALRVGEEAAQLGREALAQGAAFGFFRLFLDTLKPEDLSALAAILSHAPLLPAEAALLGRLLSRSVHAESSPMALPAGPPRKTLFTELTLRENDVLLGMVKRQSNKQVAREIAIGPETVKWHVKNIMAKLGVRNRLQAVQRAHELGLMNWHDGEEAGRHGPPNSPLENP